jgi:cAMP-dependent protein kinase regulator
MKIGTSGAGIDELDRLLAQRDYAKALAVISKELRRRPGQLNLQLRRAEVLNLKGERTRAVTAYRKIAEAQARDGFYARAIAVYKKIRRIDPGQEVEAELARLIEEDRQSKTATRREGDPDRFERASEPPDPRQAAEAKQEMKELQASTLFASFERDALEKILASTELRSFEQGDIIVTEGERGSSLYLIVGGTVKVFTRTKDGSNLPLAELGAGDFFGEVSLLSGRPRTATITASSAVTAVELDHDSLERIAGDHPEVRQVLEDFYERRAQHTVEAVIRRMRDESRGG